MSEGVHYEETLQEYDQQHNAAVEGENEEVMHHEQEQQEQVASSEHQGNTVDIVRMGPGLTVNFVSTAEPQVSEFVDNGIKVTRSYYRLQDGQPTAFVVPTNEPIQYSVEQSYSAPANRAPSSFKSYQTPYYSTAVSQTFVESAAQVMVPTEKQGMPSYFFPSTLSQGSMQGALGVSHSRVTPPIVSTSRPETTWVPTQVTPAHYDTYSQGQLAAQYRRYMAENGVQYEDLITKGEAPRAPTIVGAASLVAPSVVSRGAKSSTQRTPVQRKAVWCGC